MDFVLDEEVYHRHQRAEEQASKDLAVPNCPRVVGAQGKTAYCPWHCSNEVGDHENVVPAVIICRGDICPSSTCNRAKDTGTKHELRQCGVRSCCQNVPEEDQGETGSYRRDKVSFCGGEHCCKRIPEVMAMKS